MKGYLILFFFTILVGCASRPSNANRMPAQALLRTASCTVEKLVDGIPEKIIEAKNISVTSANGGLRQNCLYTAKDGKTRLRPIVFDTQGGILIALDYDNKQIVMTGDSTPQTKESGETKYFKWLSWSVVFDPLGEQLTTTCEMISPDRTTVIGKIVCPSDSDNPTTP